MENCSGREETLERFGLPDKKTILVSLGRNRQVYDVTNKLLELFRDSAINSNYQVVMVVDPYLDHEAACALCEHPLGGNVRFMPFVPDLVELMRHSELVVSRAGYNTVNEILLTGVKAIIIPESHGGGEQELRAQRIRTGPRQGPDRSGNISRSRSKQDTESA